MRPRVLALLFASTLVLGCDADPFAPKPTTGLVSNEHIVYADGLHNENTDLVRWGDALYLVFRGGETSQIGSPAARLKVFVSDDGGDSWRATAEIFMPDRDIRDPKLVVEGDKLVIYAISRVPGPHVRDLAGFAWTVRTESTDGHTFTPPVRVFDETWGFWRFTRHGDTLYATGYDDGDLHVGLFSSKDGVAWQRLSFIYDDALHVPSEAELRFFGDTAVALVRLDDGITLLDAGHTAVCVAAPPYTTWDCGRRLPERLDGPCWFEHAGRQYVIGRKHLPELRKRTAVYELTGDVADPTAPVALQELAELTSAGDTSYVGVAHLSGDQFLVSWYSSIVAEDADWSSAMFAPSSIWLGWLDLARR